MRARHNRWCESFTNHSYSLGTLHASMCLPRQAVQHEHVGGFALCKPLCCIDGIPNETLLGEAFHPLTGSNRAVPSTAVRWWAGFASCTTGKRLGKETWGSMKGRGLELG